MLVLLIKTAKLIGIIFVAFVIICCVFIFIANRFVALSKAENNSPTASDEHRVPKAQDISCKQYGHSHEEFDAPRFVPHKDPKKGYIVLNGITLKRNKADAHENKI